MEALYLNALGEFITASDFVERGEEVVRACSLWRQLVKDGKILNSPGHRLGEDAEPVGTVFVEVPVLFKRSKRKALPFDPVAVDSAGMSSQQIEKMKIDTVVEDILSKMDSDARERYFEGIGAVEPEAWRLYLLRKSIKGSGGHDYLRGCMNALNRLDRWLRAKYGANHGYACKPAIVGWFICENLVADEEDGHAPSSLVAGLRFAQLVLMFPIRVANSSVKFLCRAPNKMPKQAPSASVRMLHHFHAVACDGSYSNQLRGVAAGFLVMMLSALRGVDAQRSKFHYASKPDVVD